MTETIAVPVQYIITTKSDWAMLQITKGGLWTDLEIRCTQGYDKLASGILQGQNVIGISKRPFDNTAVVIHARCNLNAEKAYSSPYITYLLTRGNIESMFVQIIAGKESHTLVHDQPIPNDPRNPRLFHVPITLYLNSLKQKETIKVQEHVQPEKIKEQEETQQSAIITKFNNMFKRIFEKEQPTEEDVTDIFRYLRSNGKNATRLQDSDICRDLTLQTQARFWQFPSLKNKARLEAEKTLEEIRKRYDDLCKTERKLSVQASGLGGIEKGEKKISPKE